MKTYIGTKVVQATPMTRGEYADSRGGQYYQREGDKREDEGYKVVYPDGYISWCPKKQFEEANVESKSDVYHIEPESDWLSRLLVEHDDLLEKTGKLGRYITKGCPGASYEQAALMLKQFTAMKAYLCILRERIDVEKSSRIALNTSKMISIDRVIVD